MQVHIYNTLTRKKEPFKPLKEGFVGIYVCGPTVYGDPHLGHAKSYISFDVVVRYFRYLGYRVRYVQNITDVGHLTDDADEGEDKMAKQSRIERLEPMELAEKYTYRYFRDMDRLRVQRPDISPRATGHIPEQIAMIKRLIEKGHAYEADGNVYFDVTTLPDYGKLSGRSLDEAESGSRVETSSDKKNPADFALWKKADESHIMQWDSPWGYGFPGWHIECSAMATKYLGRTIDIHGGGLENQFPHHECEIAQCEGAHDEPFVRYWMHNNMVTLNGQKMGKSLGNAISLEEFFTGSHKLLSRSWSPDIIRFFLLQSHYRSTTDFSESALESTEAGYQNLSEILDLIYQAGGESDDSNSQSGEKSTGQSGKASGSSTGKNGDSFDLQALQDGLHERMNDDFNTAKAIGFLFEKLRPLKPALQKGDIPANISELSGFITVFCRDVLAIWNPAEKETSGSDVPFDEVMQLLLDIRQQARKNKDWAMADTIRDRLKEAGITIEDGPDGSVYKKS
ncbi:cysteine--tRNA ligase [Natronogracilivirga saccharolytica]|uniref:Cysteine--tRNA ligase n=1 Tax=Natronogracilivirga saccharolytica TaxID=2812953 RepID=A0A8J7UV47_9BACT|nr:cysteine--tRNA ligase [Natronogracilivirga saccharolytica]MBP3192197.1 cysteine--tRNA ligase [Natronogracilivirga saccharolytica]